MNTDWGLHDAPRHSLAAAYFGDLQYFVRVRQIVGERKSLCLCLYLSRVLCLAIGLCLFPTYHTLLPLHLVEWNFAETFQQTLICCKIRQQQYKFTKVLRLAPATVLATTPLHRATSGWQASQMLC